MKKFRSLFPLCGLSRENFIQIESGPFIDRYMESGIIKLTFILLYEFLVDDQYTMKDSVWLFDKRLQIPYCYKYEILIL